MHVLLNPRFRIAAGLIWCLCWPAIAVLLLMPLPFALLSRTDLLGHFLLFGVMTFLIIAFARSRSQVIALSFLTIVYGIALEFAQAHVPGRTFDIADAIANGIGGIAGCLGALVLLEWLIDWDARRRRPATSAGGSPNG